jgi:hypothetical protein
MQRIKSFSLYPRTPWREGVAPPAPTPSFTPPAPQTQILSVPSCPHPLSYTPKREILGNRLARGLQLSWSGLREELRAE